MAQQNANNNVVTDVQLESLQMTKKQRIFLIVTITLLLLSVLILSLRLADYAQQDKREVALKVDNDTEIYVFAVQYSDANGEVTVQSANGDKIVAPGTELAYTILLRNADEYAVDYELSPKVIFSTRYQLPLKVRMKNAAGEYILGSEEEWATLQNLRELKYTGTLSHAEATEFSFEWMWPYESGNDAFDTELGNQTRDVGVEVSFQFHSVANTSLDANGGWGEHPDMGKNLALLIAIIIFLASIIALIVAIVKKRKEALAGMADPAFVPAPKPEPQRPAARSVQTVSLEALAENFSGPAVINLAVLKQRGLVPVHTTQIHVTASPSYVLTKPLVIFAGSFSPDAKRIIMAAGGAAVIGK